MISYLVSRTILDIYTSRENSKRSITPPTRSEGTILETLEILFWAVSCDCRKNVYVFKIVQSLISAIAAKFSCLTYVFLERMWNRTSTTPTATLHFIVQRYRKAHREWIYSIHRMACTVLKPKFHRTSIGPFWETLRYPWLCASNEPTASIDIKRGIRFYASTDPWQSLPQHV